MTASDLVALHATFQQRMHDLGIVYGAPYEPVRQRFEIVRHRKIEPEMKALAADLNEFLAMQPERLRWALSGCSNNPRGTDPVVERDRARQAALTAKCEAGRPRVQPAELVRQFAVRGVMIRAEGGYLHVSPAEALTPADREMLGLHKAAILDALARPAAVV